MPRHKVDQTGQLCGMKKESCTAPISDAPHFASPLMHLATASCVYLLCHQES